MSDSKPNCIYQGAYPLLRSRRAVWREIASYVRRDVPPVEAVVELGPGYCDFINEFPAKQKIAFDLNRDMRRHADPSVDLRIGDASGIGELASGSVDLVFASNFLEHIELPRVEELLCAVHRVLAAGGHLMLIQPNHRLCEEHYFDDPTHVTIFDDRNIGPLLEEHGFAVKRLVPGLLPFSMKNRAPKWPVLVRLYLRSPIRPMAAQMYVVAERL